MTDHGPLTYPIRAAVDELCCAATDYVEHGWPVLRGTYRRSGEAVWLGRTDAVGLRPVDDDWPTAWTLREGQVARWWHALPYSVLVACGHGVDCIELPGPSGRPALAALRCAGVDPLAMLSPVGTVVVFARTRRGPRPALVSASLRSAGSWVAVPPTDSYRWLSAPCAVGWELPELVDVCRHLAGG